MENLSKIQKYFYPYRVLDIGANVGQFHIECSNTFRDSSVFSIEASDECEPHLKAITSNYYIGLLTKDNNEYDFYVNKHNVINTGNSIYKEKTKYYSDEELLVIKKKGVRLDDLFEGDSEFDLIKIDTQGSELDIIQGGLNLCSKAKGILLEVSVKEYNEHAPLQEEVIKFMSDFGFVKAEVLDEIIVDSVDLHQQNVLFVKKELWLQATASNN